MRAVKRGLLILVIMLLLALAGFTAWASALHGPQPEALVALHADALRATAGPWLTFAPVGPQPTIGFISTAIRYVVAVEGDHPDFGYDGPPGGAGQAVIPAAALQAQAAAVAVESLASLVER